MSLVMRILDAALVRLFTVGNSRPIDPRFRHPQPAACAGCGAVEAEGEAHDERCGQGGRSHS